VKTKLVLKGILAFEDAKLAAAAGIDGIIVSNHGGRQLDRALPTAEALPAVAAAVPGEPVYVDGGIRRAEDALAALALGARLVFLGRPALWALACGGAAGVQALLDGLTDRLVHIMGLAGASSLAELAGLAGPA
jgi:4-hydroxymandelate oxidase